MPAKKVTEAWTGSALTMGILDNGWQAVRVFHVSGATDKLDAILSCASIPFVAFVGAPHPNNSRMVCQTMVCDDNLVLRKVTATYAINNLGELTDPLRMKTRWRPKPAKRMEPSDVDLYGNPKTNSAGVPFDPPKQRKRGGLFVQAIRNEPFFDWGRAVAIQDTTNSVRFVIPGAGTLNPGQMYCDSMECLTDLYFGMTYATIAYNFELRAGNLIPGTSEYDAFFDSELDQGDSGWAIDSEEFATRGLFCNADGLEIGYVLLDGTGKPIDSSLKVLTSSDGTVEDALTNPNSFPPSNVKIVDGPGGKSKRILFRDYGTYDYTALNL